MRKMLGKTASLLTLLTLLASLAACTAPHSDTTRVKCPACGYEFDAPRQ